ncbi:MAG: hypothetical protein OEY49_16065 [Candidatus Heimdallarchaeota archaeon]|nr:hypothetical protein [Candidatus Heimdallarchaeota archaeon]
MITTNQTTNQIHSSHQMNSINSDIYCPLTMRLEYQSTYNLGNGEILPSFSHEEMVAISLIDFFEDYSEHMSKNERDSVIMMLLENEILV